MLPFVQPPGATCSPVSYWLIQFNYFLFSFLTWYQSRDLVSLIYLQSLIGNIRDLVAIELSWLQCPSGNIGASVLTVSGPRWSGLTYLTPMRNFLSHKSQCISNWTQEFWHNRSHGHRGFLGQTHNDCFLRAILIIAPKNWCFLVWRSADVFLWFYAWDLASWVVDLSCRHKDHGRLVEDLVCVEIFF